MSVFICDSFGSHLNYIAMRYIEIYALEAFMKVLEIGCQEKLPPPSGKIEDPLNTFSLPNAMSLREHQEGLALERTSAHRILMVSCVAVKQRTLMIRSLGSLP